MALNWNGSELSRDKTRWDNAFLMRKQFLRHPLESTLSINSTRMHLSPSIIFATLLTQWKIRAMFYNFIFSKFSSEIFDKRWTQGTTY